MRFSKYQGTGNDFILVNGETETVDPSDASKIRKWCDRKFGIGADGFILIRHHPDCDFEMLFFNNDGQQGSLCGNGGRCAVKFAREEGYFEGEECTFMAFDGVHQARLQAGQVALRMADVSRTEPAKGRVVLNTGSPHYVVLVEDLSDIDVVEAGRAIRYSTEFSKEGINVNFVETEEPDLLKMATYERGVEDETLSCGTGAVASAIGHYLLSGSSSLQEQNLEILTRGGKLKVRFTPFGSGYKNIWLTGPAVKVFSGILERASAKIGT